MNSHVCVQKGKKISFLCVWVFFFLLPQKPGGSFGDECDIRQRQGSLVLWYWLVPSATPLISTPPPHFPQAGRTQMWSRKGAGHPHTNVACPLCFLGFAWAHAYDYPACSIRISSFPSPPPGAVQMKTPSGPKSERVLVAREMVLLAQPSIHWQGLVHRNRESLPI